MTLRISWVENSEEEMQRALDVISIFREKDTRDELGIGSVRDSLAELMFPGTSTIQTRARYFLFVCWMYRDLENKLISGKRTNRTAYEAIRSSEVALIKPSWPSPLTR